MLFDKEIESGKLLKFIFFPNNQSTIIRYGKIIGEDEHYLKVSTEKPDTYPNQTIVLQKGEVRVTEVGEYA